MSTTQEQEQGFVPDQYGLAARGSLNPHNEVWTIEITEDVSIKWLSYLGWWICVEEGNNITCPSFYPDSWEDVDSLIRMLTPRKKRGPLDSKEGGSNG